MDNQDPGFKKNKTKNPENKQPTSSSFDLTHFAL